jgi:N-hydroxyarylamine O-acetyltransferase
MVPENKVMDIQAYLKRIEYEWPLNRDFETLRQLHLAHLLHVPFENLSIHAHEPIVLNDAALFEKIVTRRRGGFCYELNGLFGALLREVGFEVAMLSAQVANNQAEFSRDFDHMTLMVILDGERWLADVGFGDSFIEPLPLELNNKFQQREHRYRVVSNNQERLVLERGSKNEDWQPQYRFSLQPYEYSDYAEMCAYHQVSPESHFTRQRICSRLTPSGRISLSDLRLIITENGARTERQVQNEDEYAEILRDRFGIVM